MAWHSWEEFTWRKGLSSTFLCCFSQAGSRRPSLSHSSSWISKYCLKYSIDEVLNLRKIQLHINLIKVSSIQHLFNFSFFFILNSDPPVACIVPLPPLAPQTAVDSRIEPSEEGILWDIELFYVGMILEIFNHLNRPILCGNNILNIQPSE